MQSEKSTLTQTHTARALSCKSQEKHQIAILTHAVYFFLFRRDFVCVFVFFRTTHTPAVVVLPLLFLLHNFTHFQFKAFWTARAFILVFQLVADRVAERFSMWHSRLALEQQQQQQYKAITWHKIYVQVFINTHGKYFPVKIIMIIYKQNDFLLCEFTSKARFAVCVVLNAHSAHSHTLRFTCSYVRCAPHGHRTALHYHDSRVARLFPVQTQTHTHKLFSPLAFAFLIFIISAENFTAHHEYVLCFFGFFFHFILP